MKGPFNIVVVVVDVDVVTALEYVGIITSCCYRWSTGAALAGQLARQENVSTALWTLH